MRKSAKIMQIFNKLRVVALTIFRHALKFIAEVSENVMLVKENPILTANLDTSI